MFFFFFKQKTAYEMRISDWSSDVCSSDLISVRLKGETRLGTRCEVKNLNSIRNVQRAIDFEARRQIDILEAGGVIGQHTLSFDADSGTTTPLRAKETANDYRYFPDRKSTRLNSSH